MQRLVVGRPTGPRRVGKRRPGILQGGGWVAVVRSVPVLHPAAVLRRNRRRVRNRRRGVLRRYVQRMMVVMMVVRVRVEVLVLRKCEVERRLLRYAAAVRRRKIGGLEVGGARRWGGGSVAERPRRGDVRVNGD